MGPRRFSSAPPSVIFGNGNSVITVNSQDGLGIKGDVAANFPQASVTMGINFGEMGGIWRLPIEDLDVELAATKAFALPAILGQLRAISEAGNALVWNLGTTSASHTLYITLAVLLLGFSATGMMVVVYRRKKAHR